MANSVLVSDLMTSCKQRADMEFSQFATDTEVIRMIDRSYKKLFRWIVGKFDNYFLTSATLTLAAGQQIYPLPADFYKLCGVDIKEGGRTRSVRPYNFNGRNRRQGLSYLLYVIEGSNIKLTAAPNVSDTVTLWYIPVPVTITSQAQSVDVVMGFDEFVTVDVAIALRIKEETDVSALINERNELLRDLESNLTNRDSGLPAQITDVNSLDDDELPYTSGRSW